MVRAKSTRPAPVKKGSRETCPPDHTAEGEKETAKRDAVMASVCHCGDYCFLFLAAFFYFFIRPYSYRWKPCYGFKAYGVCMPSGFHVHGIDVSHYQGNIDWKMLTQTRQGKFPIHFVFMKASEGGDYGDKAFSSILIRRKHMGLSVGLIILQSEDRSCPSGRFFINSVKLDSGDLPPVLDIEKRGKDENQLRRDLKLWLDKIEQHYKVKPILYTSYKFKTRYLNDSVFNSYPYWIAHYYVDSVEYRGVEILAAYGCGYVAGYS